MSGHSKWSKIRHKKGDADAKRSAVFTKLAKAVTVAAKNGGDPDFNFSLRAAINAALSANMTKDAIDRAVKRGSGEGSEAKIEEILYEGYGPGGVAVIVEALSDNRNRTSPNIKHLFSKHGGNLGSTGSVQWMFERQGMIRVASDKLSEEQELAMIDAGADEISPEENETTISGQLDSLQKLQESAEKAGLKVISANPEWIPKDIVPLDESKKGQLESLFDALDDDEDVSAIYYNINF